MNTRSELQTYFSGKFIDPRHYRLERPPVWAPGKPGKPGARGNTLLHVAAERLESLEFRQANKTNPFILSLPGARIETAVEDITLDEIEAKKQQTQIRQEEERRRQEYIRQQTETMNKEKESGDNMITNNSAG